MFASNSIWGGVIAFVRKTGRLDAERQSGTRYTAQITDPGTVRHGQLGSHERVVCGYLRLNHLAIRDLILEIPLSHCYASDLRYEMNLAVL